jgi:hypothetical protein
MRQENRHLLAMNRRLESEKDEIQAKLELLEARRKEHINKINNDMQVRKTSCFKKILLEYGRKGVIVLFTHFTIRILF